MISFFCGVTVGMILATAIIYFNEIDTEYEDWCGCDGEGMAHIAGAEGFACSTAAQPAPEKP